MRARGLFITGTDTGVGKTWATLSLMKVLQRRGLTVVGMKPVATGAELRDGYWANEDALALQRAASVTVPYERVNPYAFVPPASPHIAAAEAGQRIDLKRILAAFDELRAAADCVLVEGVGGWKVPLGPAMAVADLAEALELPVLMVVGLRLGCLNHAWLTYESIRASNVRFGGWIANRVLRDFAYAGENLATLTDLLGSPPVAELAYCDASIQPQNDRGLLANTDEILRLLAP